SFSFPTTGGLCRKLQRESSKLHRTVWSIFTAVTKSISKRPAQITWTAVSNRRLLRQFPDGDRAKDSLQILASKPSNYNSPHSQDFLQAIVLVSEICIMGMNKFFS